MGPGTGRGISTLKATKTTAAATPAVTAATPAVTAATMAGDAPGTTRTRRRWTGRLELIITVLLGLTAVVGAFAALKNEQRNHDATFEFSEGIKNFDDAGQFYATGNATFTHDQALFLEYAK